MSSFNTVAETSTEETAATSGTVASLPSPLVAETGKKGVDCAREVGYVARRGQSEVDGREGWVGTTMFLD